MHSYFYLQLSFVSGNLFIHVGRIFGALGHIWDACRIILTYLGRKTAAVRQVEAISEGRGRILAPTWPILEHLGAILEHLSTNMGHLGAILEHLGANMGHLGAILEHLGTNMGHLGPILEHLGRVLAPTWAILATILVAFWGLWNHLEVEDALEPRRCKKHGKTQRKTSILET